MVKPVVPARNISYLASGAAPGWMAACRGAALGLAILFGLNLAEVFAHHTGSVRNWFCDYTPAPEALGTAILAMTSTAMVLFAIHPAMPTPVWTAALCLNLLLMAACGRELWQVSQTIPQVLQVTAMARPLGILMLAGVAGVGMLTARSSRTRGRSSFLMIIAIAAVTVVAAATVMVQSGGISDPNPADLSAVIVIPGEPLDLNGQPTEILTDRLKTAARLPMNDGTEQILVYGVVDANEPLPPVIEQLATAAEVDAKRLILLPEPAQPDTMIRSLSERPELSENRRVRIVAHWYQLARIRLLARRSGLSPTGIAAEQTHAIFNQNLLVAKEVAATLKSLADPCVQLVRGVQPSTGPDDRQDATPDDLLDSDEFRDLDDLMNK